MNWLIFNLTLFAVLTLNPKSPNDLIWKNRILIIQSDQLDPVWFEDKLMKDLGDRKLLIFHFTGKKLIKANFKEEILAEKFLKKLTSTELQITQWALIGLDGGVKNSGTGKILSPQEIFKIIDSMPMRQSEIKSGEN